MRQNRAIRRGVIILIVIMMLGILGISNVVADGPGGPKVIAGRVYTSEGKDPSGPAGRFNGTYAAVIVEHKGVKTTYVDPNGLEPDENETYWYAVTIPEGGWDTDDTYWIWVDGTGWDDMDFTCSGHDDPDVNSWKMDATGSEERNVNTADYNFKPLLAWIFAIILGIIGIVIGIFRPLKIPFSGWPRQPADLVDEVTIEGAAKMREEAPAEVAVAPPAEHICVTCGGMMEYVPEYGTWYCYTCQKYEGEEELPPPKPAEPFIPPPEQPPEEPLEEPPQEPPEESPEEPPGPSSPPEGGE